MSRPAGEHVDPIPRDGVKSTCSPASGAEARTVLAAARALLGPLPAVLAAHRPDATAEALNATLARAPAVNRAALKAMLALAARPRGARLLRRLHGADQAARTALAFAVYDDDAVARALRYDASAVVARGRALRRAEGRP